MGSRSSPPLPPAQPTPHVRGLSWVLGGWQSPRKAPVTPGDSPLAAFTVPSNMGSSLCPKLVLTGTHGDESRRHPQMTLAQSVAVPGLGVPPGQPEGPSPAPAAVPPPDAPSLRRTLYAARGGSEVAKPSSSVKGKWQSEGTLLQPPPKMPSPGLGTARSPPATLLPPGCPRPPSSR